MAIDNEERDNNYERKVLDLVPRPKAKKISGNCRVYTIEKNEQDDIAKYEARSVAQDFSQQKGDTQEEALQL
ncbi:hypothetical protein TNCV_496531 [Trichonephila clavipes]|nr:hypothetical protein TNCV_496531 [Trichonephila clavipes]